MGDGIGGFLVRVTIFGGRRLFSGPYCLGDIVGRVRVVDLAGGGRCLSGIRYLELIMAVGRRTWSRNVVKQQQVIRRAVFVGLEGWSRGGCWRLRWMGRDAVGGWDFGE